MRYILSKIITLIAIENQNLANRIAAQRKADETAKKMEMDAVVITQKHEEHLQKYRFE